MPRVYLLKTCAQMIQCGSLLKTWPSKGWIWCPYVYSYAYGVAICRRGGWIWAWMYMRHLTILDGAGVKKETTGQGLVILMLYILTWKSRNMWNSFMVQWLGHCTFPVEVNKQDQPGQATRFHKPYSVARGKKKTKNKKSPVSMLVPPETESRVC